MIFRSLRPLTEFVILGPLVQRGLGRETLGDCRSLFLEITTGL